MLYDYLKKYEDKPKNILCRLFGHKYKIIHEENGWGKEKYPTYGYTTYKCRICGDERTEGCLCE